VGWFSRGRSTLRPYNCDFINHEPVLDLHSGGLPAISYWLSTISLFVLLLTGCTLGFPDTGSSQTNAPVVDVDAAMLTVTWVENGDLWVWRQGEARPQVIASGGVVRPYLAPDARHVAFSRGSEGRPLTLWTAAVDGSSASEVVSAVRIGAVQAVQPALLDIQWLDGDILYFNTARIAENALTPQNDLWRANIRTREVNQLLPPGEGGSISISPDKQRIALVYPGNYGVQDGRIRVIDLLAQARDDLFYFTGVSSGASYPFFTPVTWSVGSDALYVAVPDKDLIYGDDGTTPVRLWRITPGSREREVLGGVPASFFGLPRWSADTSRMVYLRRLASAANNQFELVVANREGGNPARYDTGLIGSFGLAEWLPDSTTFAYVNGEPGQYVIGRPGAARQPLSERLFRPRFLNTVVVVYATQPAQTFELRYLRLDDPQPQPIAPVTNPVPVFDAVLLVDSR
jgi:Tol biopolymer transport system component